MSAFIEADAAGLRRREEARQRRWAFSAKRRTRNQMARQSRRANRGQR